MIIFKRQYYIYAFILLGVLIALLWYQAVALKNIKTGDVFEEALPAVKTENLVDIGVVDFDSDGDFDIFTSNHNQRSLLLKNDGAGGFTDVLSAMGLDQSHEFPGIELANKIPETEKSGFYIFWRSKELVLKWVPAQGLIAPAGRLVLQSQVQITKNSGFDITVINHGGDAYPAKVDPANAVLECDATSGAGENDVKKGNTTIIEFSAVSEAEVHIAPDYIALPVSIKMDEKISLVDIYVGQNGVTPQEHEFSFELVDRHGMAWADYNGDDMLDVYIVRGGLKGHMSRLYISYQDELYKKTESGFIDVIDETKIDKKTCPGYQLQWIDFNKDNALDLYVSCQRRNANQLFKNNGSGEFTEVAAELGINSGMNHFHTPFLWIDINQDKKADLLINYGDDYVMMINTGSGFEAEEKRLNLPGAQKMTASDYDKDGDIDVFVVSSSDFNILLKNTGASFEEIPATDLGLPEDALTANWVDYDNDGTVELHVVPGGIYQQDGAGGFEKTGLLDHFLPESMFQAVSNWVDLDNDGDRDLVLAVYYKDPLWLEWYERLTGQYVQHWKRGYMPGEIRTFINKSEQTDNHWLQFEMLGHSGNSQAIGAEVTLKTNSAEVKALVGQSEGSHLSQGQYRLYFGLGAEEKPESLEVNWPDGGHQMYSITEYDRLIKIKQAEH